jgi:hypothetical protein
MSGGATVLEALDLAWSKFGAWARKTADEAGITGEARENLEFVLARDILVLIPKIEQFLENHKEALAAGDVKHFQALAPVEFQAREIPPAVAEKAFLFAKVFTSLLNDLQKE